MAAVSGTRADPPAAFLQITDDGPGVPDRLRESLFEPYQHGSGTAGLTEPVGLGLFVSRTLARLMGGDLTYRREDGITIFELTLPRATGPRAKAPGRRPSVVSRQRAARRRRHRRGSPLGGEDSAAGSRHAATRRPDPSMTIGLRRAQARRRSPGGRRDSTLAGPPSAHPMRARASQ